MKNLFEITIVIFALGFTVSTVALYSFTDSFTTLMWLELVLVIIIGIGDNWY